LKYTRVVRFVQLMGGVLSVVFFDTLIFGLFFPERGVCESQITTTTCLQAMNRATADTLCIWDDTT
jgi:hypothetical protein